jgi:hypothetical protein
MKEQQPGDVVLNRVMEQAGDMANLDAECEQGYAALGWMLFEVATMQFWRIKYETFRDYLRDVSLVAKKTPDQLHRYFLTVRDLSDTFTAAQLESMGITKAMRVRQAKDYAIVLPSAIIKAALDPQVTVKELKKVISTTLNIPEEPGDWMDLEFEFMVTPEQRATLESAIDIAKRTNPVTKQTISKSAQMLDVMMKLSMEYLSSHFGDGN